MLALAVVLDAESMYGAINQADQKNVINGPDYIDAHDLCAVKHKGRPCSNKIYKITEFPSSFYYLVGIFTSDEHRECMY